MKRKINYRNVFKISLLVNMVLLAVLTVVLLAAVTDRDVAPPAADEFMPGLEVDKQALVELAEQFNVSVEYLQKVLPEYLVYTDSTGYVFTPLSKRLPLHPYDWDKLVYSADRIYYEDKAFPNVSYGIDVSYYQGSIDWTAVAESGVEFAIIRVGYRGNTSGGLFVDQYAIANLRGATAAGLDVGAYFYSQAINEKEAREEAEFVLSLIDDYEISYPVVFDMEACTDPAERTYNLTQQERTGITEAFCREVEKAGYCPMVYGNISWLAGNIELEELAEYPLWFAQYYVRPLLPYDFAMWQYSSSGIVPGITGAVDLNICFDTERWL